jgi:hypothetical protein
MKGDQSEVETKIKAPQKARQKGVYLQANRKRP